jgi:hypothetical protein
MAAGLGYKEFSTGDVLTAADANGYLASQVVMVFASAATRTSAIASPQEGMISYLKDTNSTEYYSGSAWVAISGASGGMTLINTGGTTLTGASVLISDIPTTYKHLCVIIRNWVPATDNAHLTVRYNDDSNANRHRGNWGYFNSAADGATGYAFDSTSSRIAGNNDNSVGNGLTQAWFFDYANTTTWKSHSFQSLGTDYATTTSFNILSAVGQYNQTSAITSLRFLANTGNLSSGTVFVYGVN